jgi:heterodisulfide reductase subunit C
MSTCTGSVDDPPPLDHPSFTFPDGAAMADPDLNELAHTRVEDCYQCGKCTAGCPVADAMDLAPSQLVRLAQTGDLTRAMTSIAIWRCVACQTCSDRCPKGVDVASVMDALRQLSVTRGDLPDQVRRIVTFQRSFFAISGGTGG